MKEAAAQADGFFRAFLQEARGLRTKTWHPCWVQATGKVDPTGLRNYSQTAWWGSMEQCRARAMRQSSFDAFPPPRCHGQLSAVKMKAGLLLICVLFAVCEGPEKAGVLLNIASVVARLSTPHDDPWPRCLALRQEARQSIVWFDYSVLMC
eukprot:s8304_g2.t1